MDVLQLGKAKYSLPKQPVSLSQPVEPSTIEPSRAGEVLRVDSLLQAPTAKPEGDDDDFGNTTQRAPQLNTDNSVLKADKFDESITLIPKNVEETRFTHFSWSVNFINVVNFLGQVYK